MEKSDIRFRSLPHLPNEARHHRVPQSQRAALNAAPLQPGWITFGPRKEGRICHRTRWEIGLCWCGTPAYPPFLNALVTLWRTRARTPLFPPPLPLSSRRPDPPASRENNGLPRWDGARRYTDVCVQQG